jgi:hypothetical protein
MRKRALLATTVVALTAVGVVAPMATADQPTKEFFSFTTAPTSFNDICAFPVTVTSAVEQTVWTHVDKTGATTGEQRHVVEQDTFSANGQRLTGLPFTFNIDVVFKDGQVTNVFADGLVEKVPLPDGTLFLSAGRLDFAPPGNPDFRITPDVGRSGNLEAFCAALSP